MHVQRPGPQIPQNRSSPPCAPPERSLRWMLLSRSRSSRAMRLSARLRRSLQPHYNLITTKTCMQRPATAALKAVGVNAAQVSNI